MSADTSIWQPAKKTALLLTANGEAFYGYMLAALLCLSLVTLPFATAVVAKIAVSR